MVRISERQRFESTQNRVGKTRMLTDEAQETVMSGRRIRKISDDPVDSVRSLRNRERLAGITQFRRSVDFARGFLNKSEEALRSLGETLHRVKELNIQMANGIWDDETRKVVAEEVKQLGQHAQTLGNTSYSGRYVFAGFQTSQPPVSPDGNYLGDDGIIYVQMDEDSFRPVSISGRYVFDVEAENEHKELPLVQNIKALYQAMVDNDMDMMRKCLDYTESSISRVANATAIIGSRMAAVEDFSQRLDQNEESLTRDNNALEGADPVKSALDMRRAEASLNATLAASARVLHPSLLQFLK